MRKDRGTDRDGEAVRNADRAVVHDASDDLLEKDLTRAQPLIDKARRVECERRAASASVELLFCRLGCTTHAVSGAKR